MKVNYSVEYYEENGKSPVLEFYRSLSEKEVAKILREIDLLQRFGLSLGMPYLRKMTGTDELWELRIAQSSNLFRVFFFHYHEGKFILLHGLKKKTMKTPKRDIDVSLDRLRKYKELNLNESR